MKILTIIIITLIILGINVLFYYILYRIFGKHIKNIVKSMNNMTNLTQNRTKIPNISHFQQEMIKIQEILKKNQKR
jgi:predicted PurR-regulated permease PerM